MYYWGWIRNLAARARAVPPTALWAEAQRAVEARFTLPGPLRRSLAVRHVDGGSCNGCESELSLLPSPVYDFSRFGFVFTPSPRHADVLVVTGVITPALAPVIARVYGEMPGPKAVVAAGDCALGRGELGEAGWERLETLAPVAVRVAGCPPSPDALLAALLAVAGRLGEPDGSGGDGE
ncbi:NADH:ubiquinone oxidoreductase [Candidatus Hydrogenisulfobacillus filiaventi]|uniref:NADH:ubiquinone oxidoreductase n=1 Tax=Candidatus Hydrogenisulfobacillus filiaventi TaxID=2707344 RepID=A0A6F8ZCQ0_9FIRM|nr:NADH:ubiquinone oxidoreductase [Candidatus Hydrogenisulfobacillus filiaventi]